VTLRRRASLDAACTMVIGKEVPSAPTCVRVSHVTATSALISWLPANSNYQHVVCVNHVEVRTVKPGIFRHTISGLSPNTIYRVTVKAKNIRSPHFNTMDETTAKYAEKYCTHVEFRTLPKGVPDPPVDVQVELGPQDGTLLVTWLPVTINSQSGKSNGVPVTGYVVYADGRKVTEVDSPTGDHALLDISSFMGLQAKHVTVRTKARESQSGDSVPTPVPIDLIKNRGGNRVRRTKNYFLFNFARHDPPPFYSACK
jgi:RIMS-binding protein 2